MNKLKLVREEKGLTQAQTGGFINRSAMFISRVENGKAQLSDAQIASLASALGVREAWLRDSSGPMTDYELTRDRRSIGERILEVRKSWHETQGSFAEMLGVSRNTISLLERNKISASQAVVAAVIEKYEVDETWLRTGQGEMYKMERIAEIYERLDRDADIRRNVIQYLMAKYKDEMKDGDALFF